MPEIKKDKRDRRERDERVNESAAEKNAEPISQITHRLGEKRIDLSFANVGRDLPFVLGRRDQIADEDREQVIINHRPVVVAVLAATAVYDYRAPKTHGAGERHD